MASPVPPHCPRATAAVPPPVPDALALLPAVPGQGHPCVPSRVRQLVAALSPAGPLHQATQIAAEPRGNRGERSPDHGDPALLPPGERAQGPGRFSQACDEPESHRTS